MTTFGFARERRIRRRVDFVRIQSHGQRATSRHFVLLVCARERSETESQAPLPSRIGIVATRKVGNAVVRNRIKRVCRECFRLWPGFVPDGIDLVVIARGGANELPLAAVREEWTSARPLLLKRCEGALNGASRGAVPSTPSPPRARPVRAKSAPSIPSRPKER